MCKSELLVANDKNESWLVKHRRNPRGDIRKLGELPGGPRDCAFRSNTQNHTAELVQ